MPKTSFSEQLRHNVLDFAWSVWTELGVSGWLRRHEDVLIDIEPLLLFTASLTDARLVDESMDWSIRYGRFVSKVRLRNLLEASDDDTRRNFFEFAATVNARGRFGWPSDGARPRTKFEASGRSRVEDFGRPALLALRVRAIFGVGARAEIVRLFIANPIAALTAAELAEQSNYAKRNATEALASLHLGGLIKKVPFRNASRYLLGPREEFVSFIGELPRKFPAWDSLLRVLSSLLRLAERSEEQTPLSRALQAQKLAEDHALDFVRAGMTLPPRMAPGAEAWSDFVNWALTVTRDLAENAPGAALQSSPASFAVAPRAERQRKSSR